MKRNFQTLHQYSLEKSGASVRAVKYPDAYRTPDGGWRRRGEAMFYNMDAADALAETGRVRETAHLFTVILEEDSWEEAKCLLSEAADAYGKGAEETEAAARRMKDALEGGKPEAALAE